MTAREQRQQRRRARAIRRRVSRVLAFLAFLALLAALVLIVAARAKDKTGEAAIPETDTLPLATVTTVEDTPPVTLAPVAEPEAVSRYAGIEISDEDGYTLACLAYHEARGEPFEGQVAVIEVVLNRCLSDYFPDTVEEVVFQKYGDVWQFSPAPYLYTAEPTETQYEAVYTAIAAEESILPLDTVYFSTGPYNDSIVAVIGNHYFCSIF